MAAPKSPPCASTFLYPSSLISLFHKSLINQRLQPGVFIFCEKPKPGMEGMIRSKEYSGSVVRGAINLFISRKEPGQPWVMISGTDFFPAAFYMQKMYPDPINFCYIARVLVNFIFKFSPVKLFQPIIGKLLHVRKTQRHITNRNP